MTTLRQSRSLLLVIAVVLAARPSAAQAATPTGPCPGATGILAQQCALASALVTTFSLPGLDVSARGTDGSWTRSLEAQDFFQANEKQAATVRVVGNGQDLGRSATPGNNLSPGVGVGEAFVTFESTSARVVVRGRVTYRWREVQGFVTYGVVDGRPALDVSSKVSDLLCQQLGARASIQDDCQAGTIQWAYPVNSDSAHLTSWRGMLVRIAQPTGYRLDTVRSSGTGTFAVVSSQRWSGIWAYEGAVTGRGSNGTDTWTTLQKQRVSYSVRSTRLAHAWAASNHRT